MASVNDSTESLEPSSPLTSSSNLAGDHDFSNPPGPSSPPISSARLTGHDDLSNPRKHGESSALLSDDSSASSNSGLAHSLAQSGDDLDLALEGFFHSGKGGFWSRLSPGFILIFLVCCQIVNYFDRGAVSGLVKPLGEYFELSKFEQGLIGAAFMLGYMVFAPLSGFLTQYFRGTRIMAFGLLLWIVAAAVASVSWGLWPLLVTRMILGFGEATFASSEFQL